VSLALLMKRSRLIRHLTLPPVACLALPYFSTLFHKGQDFRGEKFIDIKVSVLIFSTNFVSKTFIQRRNETDIITNMRRYSSKFLIIVIFERHLNFFFHRFSKNTLIQNFGKICAVGVEFFHVDGHIDMTKLIVASRHFANAPKNGVQFQKFIHLFLPVITLDRTFSSFTISVK
jgi:hypothetical protein